MPLRIAAGSRTYFEVTSIFAGGTSIMTSSEIVPPIIYLRTTLRCRGERKLSVIGTDQVRPPTQMVYEGTALFFRRIPPCETTAFS